MQQMEIRRLRRVGDEALRARAEGERQFELLVGGIKDHALYRLTPDGIVAGSIRARGRSRGTPPPRSSVSIIRASTPRKIGRRARRNVRSKSPPPTAGLKQTRGASAATAACFGPMW